MLKYMRQLSLRIMPRCLDNQLGNMTWLLSFIEGLEVCLNPSRPCTVPSWDHSTGLRALRGPAFEPLKMTDLQSLLLKTALLLALVPVKRDGDLQALSLEPSSLDFSPNDSKVVLMPRKG